MKILMISQYYTPEPFRHPDICEELVRRGHQVTAVVGTPNYPMGITYPEYRGGNRQDETLNGVRIHRCPIIARRNNILFRFLNYYSYPLSAKWYLRRLNEDFDVVFINQLSPVMMAEPALWWKKKHGTPAVLYCLDLWPESVVAGSIRHGSPIYRYFHWVSRRIYSKIDCIIGTSRSFRDYFEKQFGISNVAYLPQYAEAIFTPEQCAKPKDGFIDLMFAGNVGTAQSVETIVEAARLTADCPQIRWHVVGDGQSFLPAKQQAEGLTNITFYGRKPLEDMPRFYAMADAMLVTLQKDPILSLTLPGKVQTYLAAGKPILGAIDGEAPCIIEEAACGLCGPAENAAVLAQNARRLLEADTAAMGHNARAFYEAHFEKKRFIDTLEAHLMEHTSKNGAGH